MEEEKPASHISTAPETEDDITFVYANNTRMELSVWDLKILFGQLNQHIVPSRVDWHTAVTMPLMQAKILAYFLRLNIAFHEKQNGPIKVHQSVLPALPELTQEQADSDPAAAALHEEFTRIHAEMFK